MILLTTAFLLEAKPFIDYFSLQLRLQKPFLIYENNNISLIITGIGGENTISAISYFMGRYPCTSHLVNIGYAGHSFAAPGSFYIVDKIENPIVGKSFYPHMRKEWQKLDSERLITVTQPETTFATKGLYDMEGWFFFATGLRFVPFERLSLAKVVSDGPSHPFVKKGHWMSKACKEIAPYLETIKKESLRSQTIAKQALPSHIHFTQTQRFQAEKWMGIAHAFNIDTTEFIEKKNAQEWIKAVQKAVQAKDITYA